LIGSLSVSAAIFSQAVGAFAFFGLTVALLCFAVGCPAGAQPAGIRTISLTPPAALADRKMGAAALTNNRNHSHGIRPCNLPEAALC